MSFVQHVWPYIRWPVAVSYLWWGLVWLLVARYYLSAAARQWAAMNPACAPRGGVFLWLQGVGAVTLAGVLRLFQGKFGHPYADAEHIQPPAMTLQHGIVCSALCSAVWGFTAFYVDRSDYSTARTLMNMFCVALSSVGAMIHLYPPMRHHRIVAWRSMMLFTWLAIPAGYALGLLVYALR